MISRIIYIASLFLASFQAVSQPVMEFDSKTVDFGKILEGTISSHSFHYKNTGNKPLIIEHVSVTCGCTAPHWTKDPLQPGDTSSIYVEFNSANKMGPVTKGVNIMTNCAEPLIGLLIYADIVPDSNFIPVVDSISSKPLKLVYHKSFFQVRIPMKLLAKKGFKGDEDDAEKLMKKIMEVSNPLLYNNVWINSDKGWLQANMLDKNLQAPTLLLIKNELLNKKKLKSWIKKTKAL